MKKFQLSAITASLMFAFSDAYAIEDTCNISTLCHYNGYDVYSSGNFEAYWIFNGNTTNPLGLKTDNLNIKLIPQSYKNQPATSSTIDPVQRTSLITVDNSDYTYFIGRPDTSKATLFVPAGTSFTLKDFTGNDSALFLRDVEATLEKGVKITLDKSFEELRNQDVETHPSGILATGEHSNINNSADIEVNAKEGMAIDIRHGATLISNNHNIILNSLSSEGIVISHGSKAILNKINISGDKTGQAGVETSHQSSYVEINDSKIHLTNDEYSVGINIDTSKVHINDSDINAKYAILTEDFDNESINNPMVIMPSTNVISINNSNIVGRDYLLAVNLSDRANSNPQAQMALAKISLNAYSSKLYGGVFTTSSDDEDTPPEWFRNNLVMTLNNSQWTINHDSKFQQLDMNDGSQVIFERKNGFTTLSLKELFGMGSFTLNTDLANRQSDKIVVTGSDSGSFGLNIKDSGNEPNAENGKVTLVETATGTAKFALLGKDYVDAGAYRYRLVKEGNNWILSNKAAEKSSPSTAQGGNQSSTNTGTGTSSGSGSTATAQVALSEKSNALVSLRQAQLALVESNLEGLHQRLGELKNDEKGNVWVRNVNSRNKFDSTRTASDSRSSGFEQDVHSVQLGADTALTDNIRLGGFVGNARSDVDFDGEYGSGKVKTQSLGLYGTYLANNGLYWDNVAKYEYVKSESATTGKRKYNAYTFSTEIGRIHQLGQGWTVTPQIQAAWTRLSSQSDEERKTARHNRPKKSEIISYFRFFI